MLKADSFLFLPLQQRSRNQYRPQPRERRPRANEEIKAAEVLLVSDDGAQRLSVPEALALAKAQELDLIEVSPKAQPPVVKIDDLGRYLYHLKKKEQQQRAHSKQTEVKTLRFGFRTEKHDLERLLDQARDFLKERHLVKFIVRLRGRELTNKDYAKEKLRNLVAELKDETEIEQELKPQGTQFSMIVRAKR
jgi:translation initiation factor IF-3